MISFPGRPRKLALLGLAFILMVPALAVSAETSAKTPQNVLLLPEVRAAITACAADISKFCATVKRGEGRIARCLEAKIDEVDAACAAGMMSAKAVLGR